LRAIIAPLGSNKFPDVTININGNSVMKDLKSGNNLEAIFRGVLAEIPYNNDHSLYTIMNKGTSLEEIQEKRFNYLKQYKEYQEISLKITDIKNIINITEIEKNVLIQEELFKLVASKANLNISFYYGKIIDPNVCLNLKFYNKLSPLINDRIFDNKVNFQRFLGKAIKFYQEEVDNVYINIQQSKIFWQGSGFEKIADDLFS